MLTLRVATHNICHMGKNPIDRTELFPDHTYRNGYEDDMLDLMKQYWTALESRFSADVMGLQEYCGWFDLKHTMRTAEEVYESFGYQVNDVGTGLTVVSKLPLVHEISSNFEPVSTRRWQKFRLKTDGKEIAIFNTHPHPKDPEIRQKEYAMLIEEFRKEAYFIAFGDFNGKTVDEYEIFREAGFPTANTGLGTTEKGSDCDNIIVSPNIRFDKIEVFDREFTVSDHAVLYAEVEIR